MMESTWHRVSTALLDQDQRAGTLSVYFDYDLGNWTFGLRGEHDPMWFDFIVQVGPIGVSFLYWRTLRQADQ